MGIYEQDLGRRAAFVSGDIAALGVTGRDEILDLLPQLKAYLRRRVRPDDIDDVVQDVLLRVFGRGEGAQIAHPRSYLFQCARNVLIDRYRRIAGRRSIHVCELTDQFHPADDLCPLRILLGRETMRSAAAALQSLPIRTRQILISVRVEGQSLKTLADEHGISVSAIEKHMTRALKTLERSVTAHEALPLDGGASTRRADASRDAEACKRLVSKRHRSEPKTNIQ